MPDKKHRPGPAHHSFFVAQFKCAQDARWLLVAVMSAMQLEIFDLDSIRIESSDLLDRLGLKGQYSDLVISVQLKGGGEAVVSFLIEHKSSADQGVMRQLLAYMAALYADGAQVVVPVVVYHGKSRWRREKTFGAFEHAELPPAFVARFGKNLVDFEAVFVDLGEPRVKKRLALLPADKSVALRALSQIWKADERMVAQWLSELRGLRGERLREAVSRMQSYFAKVFPSAKMDAVARELEAIRPGDKAMLDVMTVWNGALPGTYQEALDAGVEKGLEQGIEKGLEQGIEKGLEQGIEKGLEQGIEKGLEQGSRGERLKLAERLLVELEMPVAKAAKLTDLPQREVQRLKHQLRHRGGQ